MGAQRKFAVTPGALIWVCGPGHAGSYHVVPLHDTYPHRTDQECWCGAEEDEDGLMIHRSHDGREDFETGRRKFS